MTRRLYPHCDTDAECDKKNQRGRILRLLTKHLGSWVPLSDILDLRIGAYCRRIYELRRIGFQIENRTEWQEGKRHSWYRLLSATPTLLPSCASELREAARKLQSPSTLFPTQPEGKHRDDN